MISTLAGCSSEDTNETGNASEDNKAGEAVAEINNEGTKVTEVEEVEDRAPIKMAVVLRDAEVSPSDVEIYQEIEEKTGVMIEWQDAQEAGWEEKKALLFASDDLPEAFFGNGILSDSDILKYGSQGMLIPLEDYINPELMPNLYSTLTEFPELLKAITAPDGHIYGLPSFDKGSVTTTTLATYINADWLEAVNMEVPTSTDELTAVLQAFADNDVNGNGDANDEIPLSFDKGTGYATYFFGAFGFTDNYNDHIDVQDGKVVFTAQTQEYKEAIGYFNMLFNAGLVDQEAFTHDSKAFKAKLKSEERMVGVFNSWRSTGWALAEGDDSYIPMGPLAGPNGDQLYPERINGLKTKGSFAITHLAEDPAYIMAWVDNIYDPFTGLQTSYALKDGVHIADTDGDGKYEAILEANSENRTGVIPQGRERIDNVTPGASAMLAERPKHLVEKHMLDQYYNDYYSGEHYPKVFFTLDEIDRLSILTTDIVGYSNEMYARWMQVGGIEEEWDAYITKLNEMGVEEFVQIHQDALDRFNNN